MREWKTKKKRDIDEGLNSGCSLHLQNVKKIMFSEVGGGEAEDGGK